MATDLMDEANTVPAWAESFPELSLEEIIDDLDLEGLTKEDLNAIPDLLNNYVGIRVEMRQGKQSIGWTDEQKAKALEAVGGGDKDSATMSSRIWPKGVESVRSMGAARSALNALKTDPFYTRHHPRSGLRRVRVGKMSEYEAKLEAAKQTIHECAVAMNNTRTEIKEAAEKHLKARYADAAHIFDQDFQEMFVVDWTPEELGVPPAIQQFHEMWTREGKKVAAASAASLLIEKQEILEAMVTMVDDVAERLETRRLLDKKHEIRSMVAVTITRDVKAQTLLPGYVDEDEVDTEDVEGFAVTYLDADAKGTKPVCEIFLTQEEVDKRVEEDDRAKVFTNSTPQKLIETTDYWEKVAKAKGLCNDDMSELFGRLRRLYRGETITTISQNLRQSSGMRAGYVDQLQSIGNSLMSHTAMTGKRDIIRSRSKSKTVNPARA